MYKRFLCVLITLAGIYTNIIGSQHNNDPKNDPIYCASVSAVNDARLAYTKNPNTHTRKALLEIANQVGCWNTAAALIHELPLITLSIAKLPKELKEGLGDGIGDSVKKQVDTVMQAIAKNASLISYSIGGSFATCALAYYAGNKYIKKYLYEPTLIAKKSESEFKRWIKSYITTPKKVLVTDHMIIGAELQEQLNYLMQMTKNIKINGGHYENVLLYGHPGTGKTLFAELLALFCDMTYAIIPGANVSQFLANGTAVKELNDLFDWAAKQSRGTIIFFDEAETFLADRATLTNEAQNALSLFLTKTGTPSHKIMIICATNRPTVLDPAVLSRLGMQINFPLPDKESREKQIKMHIHHIFGAQHGTFVAYDYLQDDSNITQLAERLEGCSGRTIQKMVNRLRQMALAENNFTITQSLVDRVMAHLIVHKMA